MNYRYFVSYAFKNEDGIGFGNTILTLNKKIALLEDMGAVTNECLLSCQKDRPAI